LTEIFPNQKYTPAELAGLDPKFAEAWRSYCERQLNGNGVPPVNAQRWIVAELLQAEFPEPVWIIPGMLPARLSILGGRPKVGKSWLLLQIAFAVGVGGRLFDQEIDPGKVLYLALEDSPKRLQKRVKAIGIPANAGIMFHTEWRPLHQGGMDDLLVEIEVNDYKLVIVDTLSRATPGVDQNDPTIIGPIMAQLQTMASSHNICIVVCDHIRKPMGKVGDPIDDIIDSTAKKAIADTILALYKEQGKPGAVLMGRGRDVDEIDLKLKFDGLSKCWQSEGNAKDLTLTERRGEILNALDELGASQLQQISDLIGQPKSNTHTRLQDLCNAGMVVRYTVGDNIFYERIKN
jgi:hypothetical protein